MIIAALNIVLLGTNTRNASGFNLQSKLAALNASNHSACLHDVRKM